MMYVGINTALATPCLSIRVIFGDYGAMRLSPTNPSQSQSRSGGIFNACYQRAAI